MILIAGLGNPGLKYNKTRHNMGFDCIDELAKKYDIKIREKKFKALIGTGVINGQKVILMKPQTYMNLSGIAIGEVVRFYNLDPEEELIVLCDDIATDLGDIRVRAKGSAGGHNGLKNIIEQTGTQGFTRVRLGVGDSFKEGALADHVLGHLKKNERALAEEAFENAIKATELIIDGNIEKAMNDFNKKRSKE